MDAILTTSDELKRRLAALDQKAVRPLRAILSGTATDDDRARLVEIEAQAAALRAQLTV